MYVTCSCGAVYTTNRPVCVKCGRATPLPTATDGEMSVMQHEVRLTTFEVHALVGRLENEDVDYVALSSAHNKLHHILQQVVDREFYGLKVQDDDDDDGRGGSRTILPAGRIL